MKIRLASDKDFDEVFEIWRDGNDRLIFLSESSTKILEETFRQNFQNREGIFNFWIASNSRGTIVGWGSLIKASNNPFRMDICAETSIYIGTEYINKGYGVELLQYIIKEAKSSVLSFLTTYISPTNESSFRLAKKFGFIETSVRLNYQSQNTRFEKILLINPLINRQSIPLIE